MKLLSVAFVIFAIVMSKSFGTTGKPLLPVDHFAVDTLASGLIVPWEIVFMPDETMLFTERNGKVRLYRNNRLEEKSVLRIADIDTTKKMGLLAICLHPAFTKNNYCYLAYNYRKEGKPLLKIVRYKYSNDSLMNPLILLDNIRASPNHTGCRLLFGPDGKLYITTGDADRPIDAQDLKSLNGKILRINDDGSLPSDNPFAGNDTARKEIWSYGHRNTQGIAFQPGTGQLFNSEHGPTGGDEVNMIFKGANYGWPFAHHTDKRDGMEPPLIEFTPSIGPSQLVFYNAGNFPSFRGSLLLACLRGEKLIRFQMKGSEVVFQEIFLEKEYGRIRALTVGPDGCIYFSTSQNDPPEGMPRAGYDMILRLRPVGATATGGKAKPVAAAVAKATGGRMKTPAVLYAELCAGCHGSKLQGTERAESMVDGKWKYGASRRAIYLATAKGIVEKGMPAWEGSLSEKEIWALADYIRNKAKSKHGL